MGKCPSCGRIERLSAIRKCIVCGREGCKKCQIQLAKITWLAGALKIDGEETLRVCSVQCRETFTMHICMQIVPTHIPLDSQEIPVRKFVHSMLRRGEYHISDKLSKALANYHLARHDDRHKHLEYEKIDSKLWTRIEKTGRIIKAETLEKVRRFEEAAKIYEQVGMLEKAGKARDKDRQIPIKRTEVSVDVNSLLKQIKDGRIVVVYRCPHCGGKLKVGKKTNVESLKVCEHCGSEIETMEIADFLRTALS